MLKRIAAFFVMGILIFLTEPSIAQVQTMPDFSNVRVDDLTDAQVWQILQQVEASGLGEEKLEQVAEARGMNQAEITKLRKRVDRLKLQGRQPDNNVNDNNRNSGRTVNQSSSDEESENRSERETPEERRKRELRARIFGADLFENANLTFEPNLRMATPVDYQIGPDDEILIDIYGYSEASYQLKVNPEGTINIPTVGVVQVSGATIEQASARIRTRLSSIYTGIRTGTTSVNISLGNIRSIRVVLTGEIIKPGTYSLPSVATVFNALYASGGPSANGSFRQIQIIRGGSVVTVLDIYDFLLYGSLKNNIRLQDQDVIRIPTYKTRVEVNGQVKRPGIFETVYDETLSDLIRFAGDFNEKAYKARIKVLKNTETERRIEDVTAVNFDNYRPASGDQFFVDEILDRFRNRITINGAVFRPGQYELEQGLTLSQLIGKAEGLKEDAFLNRGYITRIKEDLTTEIISFEPGKVISGQAAEINLKREDIINIPSIFDLREEYDLTIEGEVRNPGTFDYAENITLEELIIQAGGFRESATPKRIEISRRVKNSSLSGDSARIAQVYHVDVDEDLKKAAGGFVLMPFDIVAVRSSPGYQVQRTVTIEGEVLYPGSYTITNENERVSDIIKRAGGLSKFAYQEGASLKRSGSKKTQIEKEQEDLKVKQFEQLQKKVDDSTSVDVKSEVVRNDYVGIDLPRILDNPGRRYDLLLEDGDILNIPKQLQTVKVSGEVLSPSSVLYVPSSRFKSYILQSGGFSSKALKRRAYIIYANGSIASTRKFLFFNNFPTVKPGSEIFVPLKEERKNGLSTTEIVAISTGLATIATLIFTIIR